MTQISRFPLPKRLEAQMHKALRKAFADIRTEVEMVSFLDDLLTPTEKVMLAKRLAIAIFLDRGYDQRTVHTIMKTSLTTVNRISFCLKYQGNGYRIILEKLKHQREWEELQVGFAEFLAQFLTVRGQLRAMHGVMSSKEETPRDDLL